MLQRLGSAIRAELTAIESIERREDENRRVRYAIAVGFVSAVAIPARSGTTLTMCWRRRAPLA